MNLLLVLSALWCMSTGISGSTTPGPDRCSIDVFKNCTADFTSLMNFTGDGSPIDPEALQKFYCSSNFTETIQCLRDHLDPNCGPGTSAYTINRTLTVIPTDFSYDIYCKNDSGFKELTQCQTMFPKVQGYADCITGETLNKTIDPTDTCRFIESITGCSYKYIQLMCPNSTNAFVDITKKSTSSCIDLDYENSREATACDNEMENACSVAYKPPSVVNSTASEITDFICSDKGRGLHQCQRTVHTMCKDKEGYNMSSLINNIQFYDRQTALLCSNSEDHKEFKKCQALFPKVAAFQECITLNDSIDPADSCKFLKNSVGCVKKYTDLMCPESLDVFNKAVDIPPTCNHANDNDMADAIRSCDDNMDQACSIAYDPPMKSDLDVYTDFVCSGRAAAYLKCEDKVYNLCHSASTKENSSIQYTESSEDQIAVICSDKTSSKAYTLCMANLSASEDYIKCATPILNNNTCGFHKCSLTSIQKMCPSSEEFFKKLFYNELVECKIITPTASGASTPTIATWSNNIQFSIMTLVLLVLNNFILNF